MSCFPESLEEQPDSLFATIGPQTSDPIVVRTCKNEVVLCENQKTEFTYKQQLYTCVGKAAVGDKITNAFDRTHWQEEDEPSQPSECP